MPRKSSSRRKESVCPNLDIDGEPAYVKLKSIPRNTSSPTYQLTNRQLACVNRRRTALLLDFVYDVCLSTWSFECHWRYPERP